jgi:hypothetical protein
MSGDESPNWGFPRTRAQVALRVGKATIDGFKSRRSFHEIERFVFFIGYPHSGSSLVGALLNGHPEMVISHEADLLRYVRPGLTRNQLFALALDGDRQFEAIGRQWMDIDYSFPGTAQGTFDRLRVVGDKKAGNSAYRMQQDPDLLARLRAIVEVPIRVVHISRNPFDNVASMHRNPAKPLSEALERYRRFATAVDDARTQLASDELLEFNYEAFAADPTPQLRAICTFIGVEGSDDFIAASAALVKPSTNRSRDRVTWPTDVRQRVEEMIAQRPTMRDYSFTS